MASGKSRVAEQLAAGQPGPVVYLATGSANDGEMRRRIARHRRRRPAAWTTVEASANLAGVLEPVVEPGATVLLDDLGFWVTAALLDAARPALAERRLRADERALWRLMVARQTVLVAVTSEVGSSLVPTSSLGRDFTDLLGRVNQRWAAAATTVALVVAGQIIRVK